MRCNKVGKCRDCGSGIQLVDESLGLLQIERVEAVGEPAVNRSKQFVELAAACFERASRYDLRGVALACCLT
jgi:hypothetical protein